MVMEGKERRYILHTDYGFKLLRVLDRVSEFDISVLEEYVF
jgi:hypothetical protein